VLRNHTTQRDATTFAPNSRSLSERVGVCDKMREKKLTVEKSILSSTFREMYSSPNEPDQNCCWGLASIRLILRGRTIQESHVRRFFWTCAGIRKPDVLSFPKTGRFTDERVPMSCRRHSVTPADAPPKQDRFSSALALHLLVRFPRCPRW